MKYLKKNKKGAMATTVVLILVGLLALGAILISTNVIPLATTPTPSEIDFDGEFEDFYIPEDVAGTDLEAEDAYSVSNEVFSVNFSSAYDLNGTDGDTNYFAFTFEAGDMEDFEVEGDLGADVNKSQIKIRDVYVVPHEEGTDLDSSNALGQFVTDLEIEGDEFTVDNSQLLEGEYVFVMEVKSIDTVALSGADELVTMDWDANSEDSDAVEEGTVKIENLS